VQPPDNQIPHYNNDNRCDKCELLSAIKIIIRYTVPTETRNNQQEYYLIFQYQFISKLKQKSLFSTIYFTKFESYNRFFINVFDTS
jgi:hypothetical protein